MMINWAIAICAVIVCSNAATNNRIGLERPTDKPIEISDQDLSALINSTFGDFQPVQPDPTPPTPVDNGRLPDENSLGPEGGLEGDGETYPPENCECVPYYQCSTNRTIIENGEGLIDIRIKSGPCEDYLDVCCGTGDTLPPDQPITTAAPPVPVPAFDVCGKRNPEGVSTLRITGAEDNEAQFGEFPWVIAVIKKNAIDGETSLNVYQCGGSLIHPQVVLTAAHCVKGKDGLLVRAGEWDTQRKTEPLPTQNRNVREVIVHEQFHSGSLQNDIALLILDSPLELAPNIATVCLPDQGESMDGRNCVASGWGKNVFGKEGKYQVILKKVELPIVSRTPCIEALRKTRLGRRFQLHSSFLCAGGIPGKDTCKGDGGGPLACPTRNNPEIYVQAGIVAWGIGCGTETPGVYVNVAQFRNWIDNKMSQYNIDTRSTNKQKY